MKAIGLDLSLSATGVASTHASTGEPWLSTHTIYTDRSATRANIIDHARLKLIYRPILSLVLAVRPDVIGIEKPLLIAKGDTSIRLAELHGFLKCWMDEKGFVYEDLDPNHVHQYGTGRGKAQKPEMLAAVTARYGPKDACNVLVGDHNAADALVCVAMVLDAHGQPLADKQGRAIEVPASHRKALSGRTWRELKAVSA